MKRWLLRLVASIVLMLGLLALPMGCTTTIVQPNTDDQAVAVALLDHGRHASLVLPDLSGGMTRWAYGERKWYAENETDFPRVIPTLLWPTQAALGRRDLPGPMTEANLRAHVAVPIEAMWIIRVERDRAASLRRELTDVYERHIAGRVTNARYDLDFVDHPDRYSYFHNCNHVIAAWLERLGCEIEGPAFASSWRVADAGGE